MVFRSKVLIDINHKRKYRLNWKSTKIKCELLEQIQDILLSNYWIRKYKNYTEFDVWIVKTHERHRRNHKYTHPSDGSVSEAPVIVYSRSDMYEYETHVFASHTLKHQTSKRSWINPIFHRGFQLCIRRRNRMVFPQLNSGCFENVNEILFNKIKTNNKRPKYLQESRKKVSLHLLLVLNFQALVRLLKQSNKFGVGIAITFAKKEENKK